MSKKKPRLTFDTETSSFEFEKDKVQFVKCGSVSDIMDLIGKSIDRAKGRATPFDFKSIKLGIPALDKEMEKGLPMGHIGHVGAGRSCSLDTIMRHALLEHKMGMMSREMGDVSFRDIGHDVVITNSGLMSVPRTETMLIRNYQLPDWQPEYDDLGVRINQDITLYWGQTKHKAKITTFSNKTKIAEAKIGNKKFMIYKDKATGKYQVLKQMK